VGYSVPGTVIQHIVHMYTNYVTLSSQSLIYSAVLMLLPGQKKMASGM